MAQHRKLKNRQHEPLQKLGVISGAPEGKMIQKCFSKQKVTRMCRKNTDASKIPLSFSMFGEP